MIERRMTEQVRRSLKDTPVVLVQGARQTGKSTLVRAVADSRTGATYLTLDDAGTLAAAAADAQGLVEASKGLLVIDEVQKAPGLFPAIKRDVDRRRRPGRFLLTGSANVLLVPRVSESLAGRMQIVTLWPFSQGEIDGVRETFVDGLFARAAPPGASAPLDARQAMDRVRRGGYPEICTTRSAARRPDWFRAYVSTILQRDVRDLAGIERLTELPRLLKLLAARAGSLLNFADVARDLSAPQTTLKRYFALLEMTFLVHTLPAWSSNLGKRLVKSPKLYLNDSGLLAHLLGTSGRRLARDPMQRGPLVENFVVMELYKQATWSRTQPELFHFRTHAGREVDVVLEDRAGRIVGIEVKAGATLGTDDLKGLKELAALAGKRFHRGVILYMGQDAIPFGPRLHALPISAMWESAAA
ncbi:MAG: ATP-binding protein [Phycisphaerales bacterium]|nr:MAG: ATP-binding protein [Phycisphaerales bacterium]